MRSILFLTIMLAASMTFAQGSLSPAGVPSPTMKTLDQVEPGIPVSGITNINQSGSYYLTQDIAAGSNGLAIRTGDVVLDLNGFTISGSSNAGGGQPGIDISTGSSGPIYGVTVKNGTVRNFMNGVFAGGVNDSVFEDLLLTENGDGFYLFGSSGRDSDGNIFRHCRMNNNTNNGFRTFIFNGATANGNVFEHSTFNNNQTGLLLYPFQSGAELKGARMQHCSFSGNRGIGIYLLNISDPEQGGHLIANSIFSGNNYGVLFGPGGSQAINGCTIRDSTFYDNITGGISFSATGSKGNRIQNNTFTTTIQTNGVGIGMPNTADNLIIQNSVTGYQTNYDLSTNNTYGAIVTNAGAIASMNPWVNFSR